MSLTSDLKYGGPVKTWFKDNFPRTESFCRRVNPEFRDGPSSKPCEVPRVEGASSWFVGTAVGYVISVHLREDALEATVATKGARIVSDDVGARLRHDPAGIERAVVARICELGPWEQQLDDSDWSELCGLASVLATFEEVYRSRRQIPDDLVLNLAMSGGDLFALSAAVATPATLTDLKILARAAVEDHAAIRDATKLAIGPNFAQSGPLGGADADVIYDGILLDFKSTASATIIGSREAWQLLGYLFADTDDQYRIERVGIGALRRRRTITWDAQEYVDMLVGEPSQPVAKWRAAFADVLAGLQRGVRRSAAPVRDAMR